MVNRNFSSKQSCSKISIKYSVYDHFFLQTFIAGKQDFVVFIFCQENIQIYIFLAPICNVKKFIFIVHSKKSSNHGD